MITQKLKLGLLIDTYEVPAWIFHSLERIASSNYADFSVIFLNNGAHEDNHPGWFNKLRRNPGEFVFEIFNRIDEKLFLRSPDALVIMDLEKLLSDVQVDKIEPICDGNLVVIRPEDEIRVRDYNLDIIINFGFQKLCGNLKSAAKYGVWSYEHGDYRVKRGGPSGFWEVVEGSPDTGSTLLITNEYKKSGWTAYRSRFFTYPFSPARNRNTAYWVSASFLPRQIELLYRLGEKRFYQETAKYNNELDFYDSRLYHTPTNLQSIKFYFKLLLKNLYELYQRAFYLDTWFLMFEFSKGSSLVFADFKKIVPSRDRFWADPHLIQKDDKFYIFVEEYIYKNRKGHISVIEMDLQGHCKEPVQVLETGYHLSYPSVFKHDEHYYMVPESAQNRTIDLYECVGFPIQWKFKMTLMENVNAVDTTLFYHQGKWWLFTGLAENEGALPEVELFLFYSENLFTSAWKSHPLNPIISDVTCARPAGRLFEKDGKIYRPSQDCSRTYGYGFNINEIQCLSETEYVERKVAAVKPNWDDRLSATHTYTWGDGITIIDGFTRRSRLF